MAFVTDRDLLELEPGVFGDAAWTAQRLMSGTGSVSGTTLTLTSSGVDFEQAGVGAGHVALLDGAAVEVIERTGATTVTVSRLRATGEGAPIPLAADATVKVEVFSFGAVIEGAHRRVLRMVGLEPDAGEAGSIEGALGESAVVNPSGLRRAEMLAALADVYAAASSGGAAGSAMERRAAWYRERFGEERQRASAAIDLDGDGRADATRRLNMVQFVRG